MMKVSFSEIITQMLKNLIKKKKILGNFNIISFSFSNFMTAIQPLIFILLISKPNRFPVSTNPRNSLTSTSHDYGVM